MKNIHTTSDSSGRGPSFIISLAPIALLLAVILGTLIIAGTDAISEYSPWILLGVAVFALLLALADHSVSMRGLREGFSRGGRQILPAVPLLLCISMIATTWMLSGIVPVLISYGLNLLNPTLFLVVTCVVCSVISVLTGSSWSTIATIGVAFMGIGSVFGFSEPWIAGAIISGAYFGDKMSPLSDTTVLASSASGVNLFKHISYMFYTTVPAMLISVVVFFVAGLVNDAPSQATDNEMLSLLESYFNLSPWVLVVPAVTFVMILMKVDTLLTLFLSGMLGLAGIFVFQPGIVEMLNSDGWFSMSLRLLWGETVLNSGNEMFDTLTSTSGILGMSHTLFLIAMAMIFGSVMIGTGMLKRLTDSLTGSLNSRTSLVGSTVASGLFLNCCTADQYLALIIGGNMYKEAYDRSGYEGRLMSRTLEDSISVTSVLIPWNSCGVAQAAVLGIPTLVYFPYCIFNYLSPLMSMLMAVTGFGIKRTTPKE